MYILQFFGVNLAGTLLSLGIVGIAVSFAAKDIISNLFSGIILILGKSIKVGDTIEIEVDPGMSESEIAEKIKEAANAKGSLTFAAGESSETIGIKGTKPDGAEPAARHQVERPAGTWP